LALCYHYHVLTYSEALDYIYSFVDYGAVRADRYAPETFSLARMAAFMRALGDPQQRYPVVHIAGTKGKGSVAALCASVLRAAGYRTGLYTSPHLVDFRERAQVDGQPIAPEAAAEIVAGFQARVPSHPGITTFELTTALAFEHFARANVDVAVIEVGLGGRLDATNIVTPLVSVITSLSLDHTYLLGETLAEIAGEKAGIVKPGVPLVTAMQPPEALRVLESVCAERGAPLAVVGRDWHLRPGGYSLEGQSFEVWSAEEERQVQALRAQGHAAAWRPARFTIPLLGRFQVENAAVAYAALRTAQARGLPLAPQALAEGFAQTRWAGRFEVVRRRPALVVDGAHNADSAARLAEAVRDYFPGRRVCLVFGASADKDVAGMLSALLVPSTGVRHVITTQAVHPRAMDPEALADLAAGHGVTVESISAVAPAVRRALQWAGPEDVIVATGSLFVVAEARSAAPAVVAAG
jgi:dihydrofolate synthase/folylpolyglutamate synthase